MSDEIEELAAAAPRIAEAILSLGDKVDMIIVHGSVLDKSEFRPGQSDLDVLVIKEKASFMDPDADLSAIKGPWTRINVSVGTRSVLRHRNFELSFIARVLRGKVIFSDGSPINIEPPEREVAKREVVQGLIGIAFKKMLYARTDEDDYLAFDARWLIARCACFALQAFLVERDVDVAPRAIRWNLPRLIELAASFKPELESLQRYAKHIDYQLAQKDVEDVEADADKDAPESIHRARCEKAAALRIMRVMRRTMGMNRNIEAAYTRVMGLARSGTRSAMRAN